jgi:hypothetical protein
MGETGAKNVLTFVLFRRPFDPSIQMYSARTLPFWSNFMYLANCEDGSVYLHSARGAQAAVAQEEDSHLRHWRR